MRSFSKRIKKKDLAKIISFSPMAGTEVKAINGNYFQYLNEVSHKSQIGKC